MWKVVLSVKDVVTSVVEVLTTEVNFEYKAYFGKFDKDYDFINLTLTKGTLNVPLSLNGPKTIRKGDSLIISDIDKELAKLSSISTPIAPTTALLQVVDWNTSRNLTTFNPSTAMILLHREYEELLTHLLNGEPTVDDWCDLIVVAAGAIYQQGYNPELSLQETVKEISSRRGSIDPSTGKWEKQKDQPLETLYRADYSKCKYNNVDAIHYVD